MPAPDKSAPAPLVKHTYVITINATENQLKGLISWLRMRRITILTHSKEEGA